MYTFIYMPQRANQDSRAPLRCVLSQYRSLVNSNPHKLTEHI